MKHSLITAVALLSLGLSSAADAQQPASPAQPPSGGSQRAASHIDFGNRNITTPANTLAIIAGPASTFDMTGLEFQPGISQTWRKDSELCFFGECQPLELADPLRLLVGGAYGITNDIEVGALVIPMELNPDFEYLDPILWGKYRVLPGVVEVAVQAAVTIPIGGAGFVYEIAAPVRLRGPLRVDSGLFINADEDLGTWNARIPVMVTMALTPELFAGVQTGLHLPLDFDGVVVPAELIAGYTIAGDGAPLLDITLATGFPYLLNSALDDPLYPDIFHVVLGVNAWVGL